MVRILMFLSRTCIGDNGFFGLFNGLCEHLVSGSKPAYVYKQKCNVSGRNHDNEQNLCPKHEHPLPENLKNVRRGCKIHNMSKK